MTDDLKERLLARCDQREWDPLCAEAASRITELEAKLQRLGREVNLAKYGEPDFAWEIHKAAVADLEARLAAAEADLDYWQKDSAAAWDKCEERRLQAVAAEAGEDALAKVTDAYKELLANVEGECPSLVDEDSGASQVLLNLMLAAESALAAYEARRKG